MKRSALVLGFAPFLAPTLALACPAARAASCGSCGSSFSGYLVALGLGLLAGAGTTAFESMLRKRS